MQYPVVIHKEKKSDYGVIVPDLPGCFSAGKTMEEALENAREAILCHIEGLLMDKEPIPNPSQIEVFKDESDYKGCTWALVNVDLSDISGKAKRVNVTIPERLLKQFDRFAKKRGESRSGFIVSAAMDYISRVKDKAS